MFLRKKKKDVVVVDDGGYYRNLREELDKLTKKVNEIEKKVEYARDFVDEQTRDNKIFQESIVRLKRDVDAIKRGTN